MNNFPIYYKCIGNPSHPCIILITGIEGQLTSWPRQLTHDLTERGFYVVTFDNRDAGLSKHYEELGVPDLHSAISAKQQGKSFTPPYRLEDMASDVILLMNKLQISKAHILGLSMGGMIAQYVALNYPECVISLTCIASSSGDTHLPTAKSEVLNFFAASLSNTEQSQEDLIKRKLDLLKIYLHPDHVQEEKLREFVTLSVKRAHYPDGFKRTILAMIYAEPRTERLKTLTLPTLIIHGDYDPVFSIEHGKQLASLISSCTIRNNSKNGSRFARSYLR